MPNHSTPSPISSLTRVEHLFGENRPFAQCHASTLVSLGPGRLLVSWFAGTREGRSDVGIWGAERFGNRTPDDRNSLARSQQSWSEPRLIAKVSDQAHWNPVLFALTPNSEDLVLHFKVGASIRHWETWVQQSSDAGQTWTQATPLVPGDQRARGAVKNKPIQLTSGDWIAGASTEGWRRWDSFIDRSPNGLTDWSAGEKIRINRRDFSGKGLIQPSLWESSPGLVHAFFRSTDGRMHRSDSTDDAQTWSLANPMTVPNNNSGLDLARMPDGRLALACNPVAGNWAARSPLSVLFSGNNGKTWPHRIEIETERGEFSYPSIIATVEGLSMSYTWNRRRIAVATLPNAALPTLELLATERI